MGLWMIEKDIADYPLDSDLLEKETFAESRHPMRVARIGIHGSAAIGDGAVELHYGSTVVGRFMNTGAGSDAFPDDDDMVVISDKTLLRPGARMHLKVVDAFDDTGNFELRIVLDVQEVPRSMTRRGRSFRRWRS